jgi:hypothetical protein
MTGTTHSIEKGGGYLGVPWEEAYGYAQAIKSGDTLYVSPRPKHRPSANCSANSWTATMPWYACR